MDSNDLELIAQAYAFLGNSLLKPLSQTSDVGLDPEFWEQFPDFGDAEVRRACQACAACVRRACDDRAEAALQHIDVEYARLFLGPPRPAVSPWETAYRSGDGSVGFGQATVEVRRALAELGLEVSNENNQYADHLGIELLCLSEACRRAAAGDETAARMAAPFLREHPASWAADFARRVSEEAPGGYYACLADVAVALLNWHSANE